MIENEQTEVVINNEMEQPSLKEDCSLTSDNDELNMANPTEEGSISKFKSVKALEKAYQDLEKEFTKKCQLLNELQKNCVDNANAPTQQNSKEQEEMFFSKNSLAQKYSSEISEYMTNNDVSLENAWIKILESMHKTNEELINDEEFVKNYVLNNSAIKQKIVGEYLTGLMSNKEQPFITQSIGSNINLMPKLKPSNLKEAGAIAEAMFNV